MGLIFQQLVYGQKIKDIDHKKKALNSYWDVVSEELINSALDQ